MYMHAPRVSSADGDSLMIAQTEKRGHRRFPLSLATELNGSRPDSTSIPSETRDVSASGAFFRTQRPVEIGETVQFVLTFGPDLTMTTPPLNVRFWGTVVRVEDQPESVGFNHGIAVQIQRYEFNTQT